MGVAHRFHGRKGSSAPESPPPPVQTPDNLRANDKIEVLLAISEGEIEGLVDGAKSFYIGETALQNSNGDDNFQDFSLTEYPGVSPAPEINLTLGGTTRSQTVNVSLSSGVPVVRQTLLGQIDFIDVRLIFGRIYYTDNSGVYNGSVTFNIEYKAQSADTWIDAFPNHNITISGKTTSNYPKDFRFAVSRIDEPYEIRVTKVSADSNNVNFTDFSWESFQEIDATKHSYDNLAMVHMLGRASDQFSSLPDLKGVYHGLRMHVPTNYDPSTRVYTGVWDGTYKIAYCNNPAWFLNEFMTNDRFGLSAYYPVTVDKWDFYEAAQWCDEMVPDGKGGTHPRWTINTLISDPRSGKEMAKFIAGIFNGVFFDDLNGTAKLRVDKDDAALHLFTQENVENGSFSYSYTELSTRYNDFIVAFTNPELNWEEDRRRVYNQDDIDLNGRIPTDFAAIGCTNEREALRRGTYKMITALTEREMVTFRTNRIGQYVQPYHVMLIGDEDQGYSLTGRAKSVSGDLLTITLRDPIYLETGIDYTFRAFHHAVIADSSYASGYAPGLFERTVNVVSTGLVTEIVVDTALPSGLPDYFTFSLEQTGAGYGAPKPFRVMSVEEVDGDPDKYEIKGLEINRNKWYDVDNLTYSGTLTYSALPSPVVIPGPTDLSFFTGYFRSTKQYQLIVEPLFNKAAYPYYNGEFEVYSRLNGTSDAWKQWSLQNGDTILDHPEGTYDFRVTPKNYFGAKAKLEEMTSFVYTVEYNIPLPANVQNFRHEIGYNGLVLLWDKNTEPDLEFYEIREGESWATGSVVVTNQTGNYFILPKKKVGTVTYQIAAYAAGQYSNPVALTINLLAPATVQEFLVVQNNDTLVFTWDQNSEPDLDDYVIREGLTWGSGIQVAKVTGTRWTLPSNISADRHFWIKARDKSGNLSELAAQAIAVVKPSDYFNYLVTNDEKAGGFTGTRLFTEVDVNGYLTLSPTVAYGEYLHEVNLASEQYARNLLIMEVDAITPDTDTWATASFNWNSSNAQRPWEFSGDLDSVDFSQMIAIETALGSGEQGFRLNDTLTGLPTNSPTASSGVAYSQGRFENGLLIQTGLSVTWTVTMASAFMMDLWWRVKDIASDHDVIKLTASGISLTLSYTGTTDEFVLVDDESDEIRVASPSDLAVDDLVYVAIIQTVTERKLYLGRLQDKDVTSGTADLTPQGVFDSLSIQ